MELTNSVNLIPLYQQQAAAEESGFLSLTQRAPSIADNSWIFKSLGLEDVVSGAVEKEISTVVSETDVIAAVLKDAVVPSREISYSDLTAVSPSLNASSGNFNNIGAIDENGETDTLPANHAQNVTKVQSALNKALNFLDNLISNYNTKALNAFNTGKQMVKLTALLELRHAIRNCDMPIVIDYRSSTGAAYYSRSRYNYTWEYGSEDNPYRLANQFEIAYGIAQLFDITDNAGTVIEQQYLTAVDIEHEQNLDRNFNRKIGFGADSLDDENFLIGTILHEFTHSLHIPNEAVAYLMGEVYFDQEYKNMYGFDGQTNATFDDIGAFNTYEDILDFGNWWMDQQDNDYTPTYNAAEYANYVADENYIKNLRYTA
jgi:hypothetical protein